MDAQEARIIEQATTSVLEAGLRTGDIKQAGDDIVTTSHTCCNVSNNTGNAHFL